MKKMILNILLASLMIGTVPIYSDSFAKRTLQSIAQNPGWTTWTLALVCVACDGSVNVWNRYKEQVKKYATDDTDKAEKKTEAISSIITIWSDAVVAGTLFALFGLSASSLAGYLAQKV